MTLQNLDTVIAFIVVLLGVSLLITVLTQMITSLLGLRGTNLKRGLVDLLKTVHPELADHAEAIARQVLEHPLVSDSAFAKSGTWLTVKPLLSRWRLASAVRVEELVGILQKLSAGAPALAPGAAPTVEQAMAAIAAAAQAQPGPEVAALAAQVRRALVPALAPALPGGIGANVTLQLDKIAERIPSGAETALGGLKLLVRLCDGPHGAALHASRSDGVDGVDLDIFVFAAHFDALRVLSQISTDANVRAKLIGAADTIQEQAEKVLASPAAPPAGPPDESEKLEEIRRAERPG